MNGGLFPGFGSKSSSQQSMIPDFLGGFLKDSDNTLILILVLMLMKEKADKTLIIALMSILMHE